MDCVCVWASVFARLFELGQNNCSCNDMWHLVDMFLGEFPRISFLKSFWGLLKLYVFNNSLNPLSKINLLKITLIGVA